VRRVLFDEDLPRQLRRDLTRFNIRTVQEQGWSSLKNGELLRTASLEFDVLLTADRNLQYQQNIPKFGIGLVVLALRDSRLPSIQSKLSEIEAAIVAVEPGTVIRITG
jgi:predicted nuclease of predicted toxin-antitoxin system